MVKKVPADAGQKTTAEKSEQRFLLTKQCRYSYKNTN